MFRILIFHSIRFTYVFFFRSADELKLFLSDYFNRMYTCEGQKWDLEYEVRKRDWEVLPTTTKTTKTDTISNHKHTIHTNTETDILKLLFFWCFQKKMCVRVCGFYPSCELNNKLQRWHTHTRTHHEIFRLEFQHGPISLCPNILIHETIHSVFRIIMTHTCTNYSPHPHTRHMEPQRFNQTQLKHRQTATLIVTAYAFVLGFVCLYIYNND